MQLSELSCNTHLTKGMVDAQEYNKLKASDPDFYRAADSMSYGGAGKVPEANIDKMVAELNERQATVKLLLCAPPPPPPLGLSSFV